MRLWSIHPKYLDSKGLVALWRETLLAKNVLANKTKGYRHHPQLRRFREAANALHCINQYLTEIFDEAQRRDYSFDKSKIEWDFKPSMITVTRGQVNYEMQHLAKKLRVRGRKKLKELRSVKKIELHPLFKMIPGNVESWETQ